jgi:aminoglycoside phosphotransferase (APT) family kinase protein
MADLSDSRDLELARGRLTAAGVTDLRPLSGGASSLTFVGVLGAQRVVVKMAPPGMLPTRHRDVLRQARIIRALGPTTVPVPAVWWEDRGEPPAVPPLFVMSFLDGTSMEPLFDVEAYGHDEAVVSERLRNAARAMAALHRIDVSALDLDDEPVLGLGSELDRWCAALETVDAALVPRWRSVADALRATVPAMQPPALVHGDFRLGNLLADRDRITAVIDWEIWAVGDPRVDVGWFLINADPDTYRRPTRYRGTTPTPQELAAVYAAALGRPVADLDWFQALACFKSAATWALLVKRNRRRSAPVPGLDAMASDLPRLIEKAAEFIAGFSRGVT